MENKNNDKKIDVEFIPSEAIEQEEAKNIVDEANQKQPTVENITDTDAPGKTIEINKDNDIIIKEPLKKEGEEIKKDDSFNKLLKPKNIQKEKSKERLKENEVVKKPTTEGEGFPPQKTEKKASFLKTIRTYQDDVIRTMKEQKTSLTKMVVAEKKKQWKNGKKKVEVNKTSKKTVFIVSTLMAFTIIFGLVGFYFINEKTSSVPPTITELKIPTFIFPNYIRELLLTRLNRNKIIEIFESEKKSISIPLGSIIQLYLTKEDKTKSFVIEETEGNKLLITTKVFFDTLKTKAPSSLTRALDSDFIFGYHSSLGNNPFLIFKVKSYNNAFSGMLKWEKTLFNDLSPTFIKEGSSINPGTNDFQDIIISNKDVRAILNSSGKIEFAYAFPNKETLVIINNETTFQELLRRIINASLERKN